MAQSARIETNPELARVAQRIEAVLDELLPKPQGAEARLHEAMRYAVLAPGRRLRGFLAVQGGRLFGVDERAMFRVGAAMECLHTYSLLHDDLPSIEDEDERRGQAAAHKAFDEGTAILAGDALFALSFAILSSSRTSPDPFARSTLIARAAEAVGHAGLVGGQMIEISAREAEIDIGTITRLQRMKTGSLIAFSCAAGAILARVGDDLQHAVTGYAHDFGLALQIMTDIARSQSSGEGGEAGDSGPQKASFVSILGTGRACAQAELLARQAVRHLDLFDEKADPLRDIADFVVKGRL